MKRILLLSVALIFMAFSCTPKESETFHQHVKVTNNAEYPVYVAFDYLYQDVPEPEYPWNPQENKVGGIGKLDSKINSGETSTKAICTIRSTDSIEGLMIGRKMKVFFIDAVAYDQILIGDPLQDELLLDSRVYTLEDLRALNFHIQYPLE